MFLSNYFNFKKGQRAKTAIKEQGVIKTMMTSSKVDAMEGVSSSLQSQVCMYV